MRRLKEEELEPKDMKLTPANLSALIALVEEGTINRNTAAKVFRAIFPDNADARTYVREHGLEQVRDTGAVEEAVRRVLEANPGAVEEYRGGSGKVLGFLMGQTMKELGGKGDPRQVNEMLREQLKK